jgi:methyl-accepting chemotaxis protein
MKLGVKFIALFIILLLALTSAVIFTTMNQTTSMIDSTSENTAATLTEEVGTEVTTLAKEVSMSIDSYMEGQYTLVQTWAKAPVVVETAEDAANYDLDTLYGMWSDPASRKFDDGEAMGDGDPSNDLNPKASQYLQALQESIVCDDGEMFYPEIFFTDARGYAIAATGATGDFDQGPDDWRYFDGEGYVRHGPAPGGEGWYRETNEASDGIFISEVVFDDSAGIWGLEICVVIENPTTGDRVGTLKAVFDYGLYVTEHLNAEQIDVLEIKLVDQSGIVVASTEHGHEDHGGSGGGGSTAAELQDISHLESITQATTTNEESYVIEMDEDLEDGEVINGWAISDDVNEHIVLVTRDVNAINDVSDNIKNDVDKHGNALVTQIIAVAIVVEIIAIIIAFLFTREISKPVNQLAKRSRSLADGDFNVDLDIKTGKDEIGDMVDAYKDMLENTAVPLRELSKSAKAIASGDLSQSVNISAKGEVKDIVRSFKMMQSSIKDLVMDIQNTAGVVSTTSEELASSAEEMNASTQEVSSSIQQISRGSQSQADQVESTVNVMKEMSSSVQDVAKRSKATTESAKKTSENAENGRVSVRDTVTKMQEIQKVVKESADIIEGLGKRSEDITQIVNVITNITDQTNLLALNAAIEAARAGEHGRGFAVVAEEVKNLAEDSKEAAERISTMIKEIQIDTTKAVESMQHGTKEVEDGMEVVNKTDQVFGQITSMAMLTNDEIQAISSAADQQESGTEKIAKAIEDIASIAEETASASEESASSTEELTASMEDMTARAQELSEMAIALQRSASKFRIGDSSPQNALNNQTAYQNRSRNRKRVRVKTKNPSQNQAQNLNLPKKVLNSLNRRGIDVNLDRGRYNE